MKIIGISGSPRKGNTEWMVKRSLEAAKEADAETKLVLLREMKIDPCDGCLSCEDTGQCHLNDDVQPLYPELLASEGLILGTPVHFDGVTCHLKNFIDRTNPICEKLKGKRVGVIVVGQLKGSEGKKSRKRVIDYLKAVCDILGMEMVGVVEGTARGVVEISKHKNVERKCIMLGRNIASGRARK